MEHRHSEGARRAAWMALALTVGALPLAAVAQDAAPSASRRGEVAHTPGYTAIVLSLAEGEVLTAATCGLPGASVSGDTMLRLQAPDGTLVAENDDACGGLGSSIRHAVRPGGAGAYSLVASCFGGGTTCGGVIAYEVGVATAADQPALPAPLFRVAASARGMVAVDRPGGALMLDAVVEVRPLEIFVFRLAGAPLAVAGGERGGIAAGALSLVGGFDLDVVEVAIGAGAAVLGTRLGEPGTKEAATLVLHGRIGRYQMFNIEGQVTFASFFGALDLFSLQLVARLPLGPVELSLRGVGGHDGVGLGELGALIWLTREGVRPVFGVSVFAGAGGAFYQPVCRFGAACADTSWYVGPFLGAGIEWRP